MQNKNIGAILAFAGAAVAVVIAFILLRIVL